MHIWGPFRLGAAGVLSGVVLAGLLAGCADPPHDSATQQPVTSTPTSARGAGWHKVPIDGVVRSIEEAYCSRKIFAAGVTDGQPLLLDLMDGAARQVGGDFPNADHNGLGAVVSNSDDVFVTEHLDPEGVKPATMWHGSYSADLPQETPRWGQTWDAPGVLPVWLSPLMDGEEDLRAVGAVRAKGLWELHAWQGLEDWFPLDRGHQLYVHSSPSARSVLTGSTEVSVIVAGDISDRPGGPHAPPQVWAIEDYQGFEHGRWTQQRLGSPPDELTDVAQWDLGWWVAGYSQLRPVVYDFNSHGGATMPVPDTRLDADHPYVYIAGIPILQPMVLATQSADGPTVWVQKGRDWLRIPAPEGKLLAAQTVDGGVYVLIDGGLWFRATSELRC